MKKILVPTDFSDCAAAAAELAIDLARRAGAEIGFLHLLGVPSDWIGLSKAQEDNYPDVQRAIGSAKSDLDEWVKKAAHRGVTASRALVLNTELETILMHQRNHHFDWIVMGSHGIGGLRQRILGSNAQYLLRNATVPVLVVKQPVVKPIRHLLFVSDFTDVPRATFQPVNDLAEALEARIDLCFVDVDSVAEDRAAIIARMNEVASYGNPGARGAQHLVPALSVEEGVAYVATENPTDLIAIGTHGRQGLARWWSPNIAERVATQGERPLLSLRLS